MDFGLLQKTENGKFIYNIIIGIVSSLIMDLSGSLTKDVLVPLLDPYLKKIKKNPNQKLDFENFTITLIRVGVLSLITIILFNKAKTL